MKECPKCHAPVADTAEYCICGAKVNVSSNILEEMIKAVKEKGKSNVR